jgi:hypothetical protein
MNLSFGLGNWAFRRGSTGGKIAAIVAMAVVVAVAGPMGCSSKGCTEIGCSSGATVTVVGAVAAWDSMLPMNLEVCADGCKQFKVERVEGRAACTGPGSAGPQFGSWQCVTNDAGNLVIVIPVSKAGSQTLSLVATNDTGTQLFQRTGSVEVVPFYANGYDCDKDHPCFQGTTDLSP